MRNEVSWQERRSEGGWRAGEQRWRHGQDTNAGAPLKGG